MNQLMILEQYLNGCRAVSPGLRIDHYRVERNISPDSGEPSVRSPDNLTRCKINQ